MTLQELIAEIVNEVQRNGYQSENQIADYIQRIRDAVKREFQSEFEVNNQLRRALELIYKRTATPRAKVSRFTIESIKPELRKKVEQSVRASALLIKLNREEAITKSLRRLSGFVTSIPEGGGVVEDKVDLKAEILKPLKQLPFVERRVIIDQSHKLVSSLNNIVAEGGGAIAVIWHSHWRQSNYNYRQDHKDRDGVIYVIRGNWALEKGLIKLAGHAYYDTITQFAEEPFCRCYGQYLFNLNDLPMEMLTEKGKESLNVKK